MRRVWLLIIFIVLLSFTYTGCNAGQKSLQDSDENYISETSILFLAQNAVAHYWHVSGGGKIIYPEEGNLETFLYNDIEYRYFGSDLDTMDKLYLYLGEVYLKEGIDEYIKLADIIEFEGRLAQPNADGGDLRMWEAAAIVKIEDKDNKKECIIKLPYPEDVMEPEEVTLIIEKINDSKWVIANVPGSF